MITIAPSAKPLAGIIVLKCKVYNTSPIDTVTESSERTVEVEASKQLPDSAPKKPKSNIVKQMAMKLAKDEEAQQQKRKQDKLLEKQVQEKLIRSLTKKSNKARMEEKAQRIAEVNAKAAALAQKEDETRRLKEEAEQLKKGLATEKVTAPATLDAELMNFVSRKSGAAQAAPNTGDVK